MKKIEITKVVDNCRECPYFWEPTYTCTKEKRKLDTPYYVIPSWCPFEDIGEENEEIPD